MAVVNSVQRLRFVRQPPLIPGTDITAICSVGVGFTRSSACWTVSKREEVKRSAPAQSGTVRCIGPNRHLSDPRQDFSFVAVGALPLRWPLQAESGTGPLGRRRSEPSQSERHHRLVEVTKATVGLAADRRQPAGEVKKLLGKPSLSVSARCCSIFAQTSTPMALVPMMVG